MAISGILKPIEDYLRARLEFGKNKLDAIAVGHYSISTEESMEDHDFDDPEEADDFERESLLRETKDTLNLIRECEEKLALLEGHGVDCLLVGYVAELRKHDEIFQEMQRIMSSINKPLSPGYLESRAARKERLTRFIELLKSTT